MKSFVLTIEYELFFGSDSGTVENSMVRPMRKLLNILSRHGMKCTVFWDVMHYVKLCQLSKEAPALSIDRDLIEKQIHYILALGHDVQMHLHPHWLDTTWDGSHWSFNYQRYTIQKLSTQPNVNDPNTLMGCITLCRQTLEQVCRKVDPSYRVKAFRAGSNSVVPFSALAEALEKNGIYIDSSAAYGMVRQKSFAPYDFSKMSQQLFYRFNESPLDNDHEGKFYEFPVETIKMPFIIRYYLDQVKRIKYIYPGRYGDGLGLGTKMAKEEWQMRDFITPKYIKLSPEESFPEEWNYLLSKSRNNGVMVLQPKNMSPFTYSMISKSIEAKQIKFISLDQRLKELGI
jgi:hypothetical protein